MFSWLGFASQQKVIPDQVDSLYYYSQIGQSRDLKTEDRLQAIDKAIRISRAREDTTYLRQLRHKIDIYGKAKKFDLAKAQASLLLKEATRLDQMKFEALAYEQLGKYLSKQNRDIEAYEKYILSLELFTSLRDSLKVIIISSRTTFIQLNLGDLDGAEFTAVNALEFSPGVKDISKLPWLYDALARIYRERSLWGQSIEYHSQALQLETESISKVALINNYSITLIKAGRYKEALVKLEEALSSNAGISNRRQYRLMDNLAFAKAKLNDPEAISLLEQALELRKTVNDFPGQFASHKHLSEAYSAVNNPDKVRYHAQQAYDIATLAKNNAAVIDALDLLIPVTKKNDALFKQYTRLSDSLTTSQNKAKFEFAKLRYDVEKAEERELLALKLKSDSELREDIAVRKRNWAFAGAAFVILLGLVLFLYQRERSKKQRLLDQYATEKRLAKKLHDELANEIYLVMTQLEEDKTTPLVADKLDHIYKLSRDMSRETQPIHTGDSFPDELALSLQTYTSSERKLILRGMESIDWKVIKPEKKIEIYRVLQELMTNMKKHSKASLVALVFKNVDKLLEINYSDNGQGVTLSPHNRGGGLTNTETRLKSMGGCITFDSAINQGFRAELSIPL